MSAKHDPYKPLFSVIAVRVINALMQFGILALIARSVSVSDFGGYAASVAVGTVAAGFLGFGLSTRVLRIQAESSRDVLSSATRLTSLSALLAGGGAYFYGVFQGSPAWSWALAGGAYVASELYCNLLNSILFGEQRRRRAEIGMLLRRGFPFVVVVVTFGTEPSVIFEAVAIAFLATPVALRILVGRLPWGGWRPGLLIRGSVQYWMTSIWTALQQLDVVLVNALLGLTAAGGYGAAFRLASPIHIVTTSITSLLIPELSRLRNRNSRRLKARPYLMVGYGYAALVIILSPLAAWVGPVLFGPDYSGYSALFVVFFLNSGFSVINQIQVARLYGESQIKVVTVSTAVCTIVGLGLLAFGALSGGVVWAAAGYAASRVLLMLLLSIQLRREFRRGDESTEGNFDG